MTVSTISPEEVMRTRRTIAVVGASKNPEKEANMVPLYLRQHGYRVVPVNPSADQIVGEKAYPSLDAIPDDLAKAVEVVDVFRPSEELPQVARQVAELARRTGRTYVFWAQLGLKSDEAMAVLEGAGLPYVMDACMKIVHESLTSGARRA